jgi:hypothetical protein
MEAKRNQFVLRMLPSFTDFAFLMPIAYLFGSLGGSRSLLGDCDTGWHIRTGEWILANHKVPFQDIFSFSKPGQPWFAWEWLSDILLAWLNNVDGLRAVLLFSIALICVTFTLLYFVTRRKCNHLIAITVTMVAAAASSIHWLARPHLFTLLFLVLFYGGLERVREGRKSFAGVPLLAIFPFVTVLWTNLHGGFFVGILLISAYGAGELLQFFFLAEEAERREAGRNARAYLISAAACAVASLINPYTYHLHVHMAQYLRDPWNSEHIIEFLSPNFHQPRALFFEAYLVASIAAAFWCVSRRRFVEPILIALWAHGGLLAARNIAIFVIVAAPIVGAAAQHVLDHGGEWSLAGWFRRAIEKVNRMAAKTARMEAAPRWHVASAFGFAMVALLMFAPHPPEKFRAEFDPNRYPAAALTAIRADRASRIFTHDEWGDYLIWTGHRSFVDGRSDFFGDDFEQKCMDVLRLKLGWEKTLSQFGVDTILMPLDAPLTGALKESSHWSVVYDDGMALVFRSTDRSKGATVSAAVTGGGESRDREVTKTEASDPAITQMKSKS